METLELDWHNLLFDIRRSIRYHHRRRAFFDRLDQMTNMLSVIFGSAAVYGVLEQDYKALALTAAGLVTGLSAVNLVLGSAQRARAHSDFARQFIDLEKRLTLAQADQTVLQEAIAARLSIEAEEPPVLHVLNVICHNEQMRAMGYPKEKLAKVRWWQRAFAQMMDLREDLIHA
jgi:hypothetical protein